VKRVSKQSQSEWPPGLPRAQAEIKAELDNGVFATRVHAKYKDRLPFSYRQFLNYVDQYRLRETAPLQTVLEGACPPRAQSVASQQEPKSAGERTLPAFEYDPMDVYRKPK
jgi:hypothetical protein